MKVKQVKEQDGMMLAKVTEERDGMTIAKVKTRLTVLKCQVSPISVA